MPRLVGFRVLVLGASRGLGHAFVEGLAGEGAAVVAAARTKPESSLARRTLSCDVRSPESCREVVAAAVEELGGLDALIYAPGVAVATELAKASSEHWRQVIDTNLVGSALVTGAAIKHLEESEGIVVFFSSVSAHVTPPWVGMGLYAVSKIALEKSAEVWKLEHPRVRFTTVVVGSTGGTSFFASAIKPYPEDLDRFFEDWQARGYLAQEQLTPGDQTQALIEILGSRAQMDQVWVRPRTLLQRWSRQPQEHTEGS